MLRFCNRWIRAGHDDQPKFAVDQKDATEVGDVRLPVGQQKDDSIWSEGSKDQSDSERAGIEPRRRLGPESDVTEAVERDARLSAGVDRREGGRCGLLAADCTRRIHQRRRPERQRRCAVDHVRKAARKTDTLVVDFAQLQNSTTTKRHHCPQTVRTEVYRARIIKSKEKIQNTHKH